MAAGNKVRVCVEKRNSQRGAACPGPKADGELVAVQSPLVRHPRLLQDCAEKDSEADSALESKTVTKRSQKNQHREHDVAATELNTFSTLTCEPCPSPGPRAQTEELTPQG